MSRFQSIVRHIAAARALRAVFVFYGALALISPAIAQQPAPSEQPPTSQPAPSATPPAAQAPTSVPDAARQPAPAPAAQAPAAAQPSAAKPAAKQKPKAAPPPAIQITEAEIRQQLVGKPLYLRGGYLDNTLSFNELGALIGESPRGSYTLNGIRIDRVHLGKHKLVLEGARYGLHFLGAAPDADSTNASMERVNITPKKKMVKITIDRELVVMPRGGLHGKREGDGDKSADSGVPAKNEPAAVAVGSPDGLSDAGQMKAQIAAAPPEERPADAESVTATTSPSHAAKLLKDALDSIFAPGIDDRLKAAMPAFWKLYYQSAAANTGFRPSDPAVLRQNMVDKKAKLITVFEPQSNEYAQAHAVSGMALYHTVIGADGKPTEIAVGRPIGFGLDENAVEAISKASFEPAIKDGKPVPVLLELTVQFRIYSNRTAAKAETDKPAETKPDEPSLPGPYSVQHP
jgi:TonB family protein